MKSLAVLITCFNRKAITLRCLNRLFSLNFTCDVYLVDDKSSDGTSAAIAEKFPQINIIQGNGDLFWSRGMRLAWQHGAKYDYDFYLWLNDDVVLYDSSIAELFACSSLALDEALISGIIESHDRSTTLYGGTGSVRNLLVANGEMQSISNMNGNVVLIPRTVFNILGNIDPVFHHDLGDVDYGLRAQENNIKVLTTRVAIGSGDRNEFCRVRMWNTDILTRINRLYSPLGSSPIINFYFRCRHYGYMNAIAYFVFIHLINFMPDKLVTLFFGKKYH